MEIFRLTDDKKFASNCYILVSEKSFSVVDPSISYEDALMRVPAISSLEPEYVLLTHGHLDHIWEIDTYVERGLKVLVSEEDGKMLSDTALNCAFMLRGKINSYKGEYQVIKDGEAIKVGDNDFKVISTPGHTKGSLCYLSDEIIFTGDTLFAGGSYGRYDLPSGNREELSASLRKLFMLPEDLRVYSGHGEATKLKDTKSFF